MACKNKSVRRTIDTFTDGTTTAIYHSVLRMRVADWAKARITFFVEGSSVTGSGTGQVLSGAAAYGNQESDFDSPTVVDFPSTPQTLNGDGNVYGSAYQTLDASKQMIDFGLKCKNQAGESRNLHAHVTVLMDLSE